MEQLIAALPYLACPVGMGLMMWMMSRRQRDGGQAGDGTATAVPAVAPSPAASATADAPLADLRAELARVRAHQEAIAREIDALGAEDGATLTREDEAGARAAGRGAAR